jgi:ABC-2 type transport system ATP-binding protein
MLDIEIQNKKYGQKVILNNIKLSLKSNGIYGVIGKNGQGKTTFFRCIKDLIPYDGTINYNNKPAIQNEIAWCATEPLIYDELTAKEFSEFYRKLLNIKEETTKDLFSIDGKKLVKEFSTGMKKKAYLNAVLQKEYTIYIFDEPFNGLDLESNYILMNYIKEISKTSIVFISSHILEILFKNCDSIFLINNQNIEAFSKEQFSSIEEKLFSI